MKIAKKDARLWFEFFASLPEDEELTVRQQEIAYAVLAQIDAAVEARHARLMAAIPGLKNLKSRTYYVGDEKKFPQGCRSCLLGTGLGAVRKTNRCNAACKFCYDYGVLDQIPPIGDDLWEIGGTKFAERDLDLLFSIQQKPTGIAYVYLEPFVEIEKYYGVIRKFHENGVYQHLYTNGIAATEETLKALGAAGLDELRFNLGATDCSDRVIANIALAKRYIPAVGIETPMTRSLYRQFLAKKDAILATGVDFINLAELHLNENNLGNYPGEEMYIYRQGYLSPIFSRELTLKLMRQADAEKWAPAVHDCSNRTKFARDLNLGAREGKWFGAGSYGGEFAGIPFAALLPTLESDELSFLEEEELPEGYRPGDACF